MKFPGKRKSKHYFPVNARDPLKQPVEAEKIKDFYQKWYTPDAMTLLVVGNVDALVNAVDRALELLVD